MTIDNLTDDANKDEFTELVKRRKPDVIVVGGMSMSTTKLMQSLKELVAKIFGDDQAETSWGDDSRNDPSQAPPVVYVQDEVARIFQHSKRAEEDFPQLSLVGRYCAGLARYTQSPLNEYAALGSDLTAITFDEEAQPLVRHALDEQN
jgi:transcription elongation factor SPT6